MTGVIRKFDSSSSININTSTSNSMKLGTTKKKMTIKPFKKNPQLPDNFQEETWKKLEKAIIAVQQKKKTCLSREELYHAVEDMCTWKMADLLYRRLEQTCATFIKEKVLELYTIQGDTSTTFLEAVYQLWQDHCEIFLVLRTIFLYLDRTYVMQTANIASIWEMGLHLLRENLCNQKEILSKLIQGLLDLIEQERNGETIPQSQMYHLLKMLFSLNLYHVHFESSFLMASEVFYTKEGIDQLDRTKEDVSQFLFHVEKRLQEENDRLIHYLDVSTKKQLIPVVETHLFKPHIEILLERGFFHLMDQLKVQDLKRMYQLYQRVGSNAMELFKNAFGNYIKKKISSLVMDVEQEKTLVDKLLQYKQEIDLILCKAFENHADFVFTLKSSMEFAINVRTSRPAELVAKFVDAKLRTGNKGTSEAEVETLLDRVMVIFRYLQSKDVFEAFYKKDLAKRLLLGKSASFDLEKMMLGKLKTECGSSFTNKLEGMFKDIDLSHDVMTQFLQHAPSQQALYKYKKGVDMQVQVLTTGFWPAYVPNEINLPSSLVPLKDIFDHFYSSKYQGRQLQWQHSLGHCIVKAIFPTSGKKELAVSLFQAIVLLCFNDIDKKQVGFKEIKEQTRIEDGELRRTLQSLACGKVRVITKNPKGKEIKDEDAFGFNENFTNQFIRIKINSIQLKETKEENEETHERIFRERQYQVDAAIVRIMKARKKLSHAILMSEIFAQLRFPAKPADIKRRIESLIDREYLERDPENTQMYNYLA